MKLLKRRNQGLGRDMRRFADRTPTLKIFSETMQVAARTGATNLEITPRITEAMRIRSGPEGSFKGHGVSTEGPVEIDVIKITTPGLRVMW